MEGHTCSSESHLAPQCGHTGKKGSAGTVQTGNEDTYVCISRKLVMLLTLFQVYINSLPTNDGVCRHDVTYTRRPMTAYAVMAMYGTINDRSRAYVPWGFP